MILFGTKWEYWGVCMTVFAFTATTCADSHHIFSDKTAKTICSGNSVTIIDNETDVWPYQSYVTANSTPPSMKIHTSGEPLFPAFLFLTQQNGISTSQFPKSNGPLIMTDSGELIWAGPSSNTANLRVQTLFNKPVISYWQGLGAATTSVGAADGYGEIVIRDTSYAQIYSICPPLELTLLPNSSSTCHADIHESYITPNNTILITAYNITTADLTSVGGPQHGYVYDSLAVEVDIASGDILFIWSPLAHVPINTTQLQLDGAGDSLSNPFDWFHINSIQPFEDHYLINGRNTWTTYLVNRSGQIVWKIDGENGGDFGAMPEGGHFSWQHYTRLTRTSPNTANLHMFANDNGNPMTSIPSVGLSLSLALPPDTSNPPKLLTNLSDPHQQITSFTEGSHSLLPNGNHFIGYGLQPYMKEFGSQSPTGADVRWSAQFGFHNGSQSYRSYKSVWHATPSTKPSLVVKRLKSSDELTACDQSSELRGYVSWNGATDVSHYEIYTDHNTRSMGFIGMVQNHGFETKFVVPAGTKSMKVAAIQLVGEEKSSTMSEIVYI